MTGRSVPEWIGATPDTEAPVRVKLRVLLAHGNACAGCGQHFTATRKPQFDHRLALTNQGENRERNLQPLCDACHKPKSKADVALKAKVARVKASHLGIARKTSRPLPGGKGSAWKHVIGQGWVRRDEA